MRILQVVTLVDDQASYGGMVTIAVNQCLELRRRGHDARIIGGWRGNGRPPTQLEGVPAHLFRIRAIIPGMRFSLALVRWVRDHAHSFDMAHLHLARHLVPLSVAVVLQREGIPYVVQAHGTLQPAPGPRARFLDRRMTRQTLLAARHVFVRSPDERDALARIAGTAEGISLLHNGVMLPERVPASDLEGPADVLFLGRLQPDRRVMAFARAAERLVTDGVDATFSVVGPDGGDLRTLLRFIAERPDLAGRLRYEGVLPHDRAVKRLRRADLYVLPSVEDQAYPMSLLEAMAAGVASICTTECGLAGTLARERAAIVANPTVDAIYGAMRRLLINRPARARISARAAATAASVFSIATVAETLEREYGAPRTDGTQTLRRRLLWITGDATYAHVEVWDALRTDLELVVVLLDHRSGLGGPWHLTGRRTTGRHTTGRHTTGQRTTEQDHVTWLQTELTGRGYTVLRASAVSLRAPQALRVMVRDRPDVVILDHTHPGTQQAVARWARWSRVPVLRASPEAGPGEAVARMSLLPGIGHPLHLDLRPLTGTDRNDEPARTARGTSEPPPRLTDVVDLSRPADPHRGRVRRTSPGTAVEVEDLSTP